MILNHDDNKLYEYMYAIIPCGATSIELTVLTNTMKSGWEPVREVAASNHWLVLLRRPLKVGS